MCGSISLRVTHYSGAIVPAVTPARTRTFTLTPLWRKRPVARLWTMPGPHRVCTLSSACQPTCPFGSCKPTTSTDLCFFLPPLAGPLVKVGDGGNFNMQQASVSVCECVREKERQRDRERAGVSQASLSWVCICITLVSCRVIGLGNQFCLIVELCTCCRLHSPNILSPPFVCSSPWAGARALHWPKETRGSPGLRLR